MLNPKRSKRILFLRFHPTRSRELDIRRVPPYRNALLGYSRLRSHASITVVL
jgi:hypothetical protein